MITMEDREERLMALHPRLTAYWDVETGTMNAGKEGWTMHNNELYSHVTTIDLSGYASESLSFAPMAVGIQDPGLYWVQVLGGATGPPTTQFTQVLDIITSVPIDPQIISDLQTASIGMGMLGSREDFKSILLGQYRMMTPSNQFSTIYFQQLQRSQRFDAGEPTAADKLYCYRIVKVYTDGSADPWGIGSYVQSPAARQILQGMMITEDELVHMMRLKRSYELASDRNA